MPTLTVAFCTYNRADRLPALVGALRKQACPIAFEILAVNNNSKDTTLQVLAQLAQLPGAPLRYVTETEQGIVPARNRALHECMQRDYFVFLDDDEMPLPGFLGTAYHALHDEKARCVGGRIQVDFSPHGRPSWLGDDLLGFLAAVDYGTQAFWIKDSSTPVWTANVGYDMRVFRDNPHLRFDLKYNRAGTVMGGGEDVVMFKRLLEMAIPMRYRPDMQVAHFVEPWRLQWRYFIRLHYSAGLRKGRLELPNYPRAYRNIPPFMVVQALRQTFKALARYVLRRPDALRQAMNASHAYGLIAGLYRRWHESRQSS